MIRVGRRAYLTGGGFKDPSFDEFIPIIVMTPSTAYGKLGPYCLKNDDGQILENVLET